VVARQRRHEAGVLGLGDPRQLGFEQRRQDAGPAQHGRPGVFAVDGLQHLHHLVNGNGVLDGRGVLGAVHGAVVTGPAR